MFILQRCGFTFFFFCVQGSGIVGRSLPVRRPKVQNVRTYPIAPTAYLPARLLRTISLQKLLSWTLCIPSLLLMIPCLSGQLATLSLKSRAFVWFVGHLS
jgi:hypothetical protein